MKHVDYRNIAIPMLAGCLFLVVTGADPAKAVAASVVAGALLWLHEAGYVPEAVQVIAGVSVAVALIVTIGLLIWLYAMSGPITSGFWWTFRFVLTRSFMGSAGIVTGAYGLGWGCSAVSRLMRRRPDAREQR